MAIQVLRQSAAAEILRAGLVRTGSRPGTAADDSTVDAVTPPASSGLGPDGSCRQVIVGQFTLVGPVGLSALRPPRTSAYGFITGPLGRFRAPLLNDSNDDFRAIRHAQRSNRTRWCWRVCRSKRAVGWLVMRQKLKCAPLRRRWLPRLHVRSGRILEAVDTGTRWAQPLLAMRAWGRTV